MKKVQVGQRVWKSVLGLVAVLAFSGCIAEVDSEFYFEGQSVPGELSFANHTKKPVLLFRGSCGGVFTMEVFDPEEGAWTSPGWDAPLDDIRICAMIALPPLRVAAGEELFWDFYPGNLEPGTYRFRFAPQGRCMASSLTPDGERRCDFWYPTPVRTRPFEVRGFDLDPSMTKITPYRE